MSDSINEMILEIALDALEDIHSRGLGERGVFNVADAALGRIKSMRSPNLNVTSLYLGVTIKDCTWDTGQQSYIVQAKFSRRRGESDIWDIVSSEKGRFLHNWLGLLLAKRRVRKIQAFYTKHPTFYGANQLITKEIHL